MPLTMDQIELQLCQPRPAAFDDPAWLWELKLDGFRLLAGKQGGQVRLMLRRGRDATGLFPEVVEAFEAVPHPDFVVDGELVIQDASGHPIFQQLLKRSTLTSAREIAQLAQQLPAVYFAFDLLALDGKDLRELPLSDRKRLLLRADAERGAAARASTTSRAQGAALLERCRQRGLEGVVGKHAARAVPRRPGARLGEGGLHPPVGLRGGRLRRGLRRAPPGVLEGAQLRLRRQGGRRLGTAQQKAE